MTPPLVCEPLWGVGGLAYVGVAMCTSELLFMSALLVNCEVYLLPVLTHLSHTQPSTPSSTGHILPLLWHWAHSLPSLPRDQLGAGWARKH